jgi:predicted DNA-binding transcriptional regulator AlpA
MKSVVERNLDTLLNESPKFLTASDLVEMGLFPSNYAVYKAKERGKAPPSISFSRKKLRFSKSDLINWIESKNDQLANQA